jgi:hypothetical protein
VHRPTLAILNGTTVTGLARAATDTLTANRYPDPNVVTTDTTNQSAGAHDRVLRARP